MIDIQILHMLNKMVEENFCLGFGSTILTRIFMTVHWLAPSTDQKCKPPIVTDK